MQARIGSFTKRFVENPQQGLVNGHHGEWLGHPYDVEDTLLDGIHHPQALKLHGGVTRLRRIQPLRAAGDKPLLSVRPFLDEGKCATTPACLSEEIRFQLRVEVMSHGRRSDFTI